MMQKLEGEIHDGLCARSNVGASSGLVRRRETINNLVNATLEAGNSGYSVEAEYLQNVNSQPDRG